MANIVKTSAKITVALGAVYVTLDEGIWSNTSALGTQALDNIRTRVFPATNQYLNKVPTAKCINAAAVNTWNSGVQKAFGALAAAPDTACHYSHVAYDKAKQAIAGS